MNKKAIIDLILSRVPEEKKEAFIAELRAAKTKKELKLRRSTTRP